MNETNSPHEQQNQNFTTKEVTDFGKDVGKDVIKQALVWSLAAFATQGIRNVIGKLIQKTTKQ